MNQDIKDKAQTFDILNDTNIYDLSGLMLTPAQVSMMLEAQDEDANEGANDDN